MKIKYYLLGVVSTLFILAVIFSLKVYFTGEPDSEEPQTVAPLEQQDTPTVLFTNVYRGNGVKNKYAKDLDKNLVLVVNSKTDLDTRWSELFEGTLAPPKPAIKFDSQTVFIAMLKQKNKGEHLLTIQSINHQVQELTISTQEKGPGNGCPARSIVSRPIHIVITEKFTDGTPPVLRSEQTTAAPCLIPLN